MVDRAPPLSKADQQKVEEGRRVAEERRKAKMTTSDPFRPSKSPSIGSEEGSATPIPISKSLGGRRRRRTTRRKSHRRKTHRR